MKHLLLIIGLALTLNASAQKIDTVKNAIIVKPVLMNWINKDTAYQVTWQLFGITRDTTQGCNSYVEIFDRKGKKIADKNVPIDAKTLMAWIDDIVIDNYILQFLGLTKK